MLQIEYFHPGFYDVLNADQELEKISSVQTSGMCWSARSRQLDYTDERSGKNFFWNKVFGEKENTLISCKMRAVLRDCCDRLVGIDVSAASLVRWHEGSAVRFAGDNNGKKLAPEAVVNHRCGILYFAEKSAVYYVMPENFSITSAFTGSNLEILTIALAADESLFFLSDKTSGAVLMLEFESNAVLSRPRTFAFGTEFPSGAPTSITTDPAGRLYCASPAGIHIFDSAGVRLARLAVPGAARHVAVGGENGKTLFAGTSEGIYTSALCI
jgi:sugar lactone lactonase YvrE